MIVSKPAAARPPKRAAAPAALAPQGGLPGRPVLAATTAPAERLHLGGLDGLLGFQLRLAQEASFQAFARRSGDTALRPGRFAILAIIGANPGLSQTALGAAAGRDKSTLTPALADLEKRGLIQRQRQEQDRRSYALTLTPAGEAALSTLSAHAAAHDAQLDALVGAENRDAFLAILRRLVIGLGA
ncbi:MarR family winged helix-turn-helix transcriptional regulator [Pseudoroseomonas cervicalis]|uniref:MarR family winged helix-turn-helix transcriptional regulator n=1 Tax=Teichococcus cervicalis TaxID=204525 RepID=UPI0022F1A344|nr:MarR family winged helix-turn-helix transcriptional regulator [Pseudoroseomonas cervicalis]WBV44932.1 MarR family winged helix-turn-helix transcriptional regulator [Pseudoroseomonas cervicalis]